MCLGIRFQRYGEYDGHVVFSPNLEEADSLIPSGWLIRGILCKTRLGGCIATGWEGLHNVVGIPSQHGFRRCRLCVEEVAVRQTFWRRHEWRGDWTTGQIRAGYNDMKLYGFFLHAEMRREIHALSPQRLAKFQYQMCAASSLELRRVVASCSACIVLPHSRRAGDMSACPPGFAYA